jgi:nucleoside-diphosphate-sugar epimerase
MTERGIAIIDDDAASSIPEDVTPVVVDLTIGDHDDLGRRGLSVTERCERLVERCDAVGAQRVVMMSSAMVYGAHRTNAVPLTEDAVMRPDTEFVFARQLAAAEATLDRWRHATPERVVGVLRPAIVAGGSGASALGRALVHGVGRRAQADDPPVQFLHVDDLAAAVVVAVESGLDGVANVAPDGWIPGDRLRALAPPRWRPPLPDRWAEVVSALGWRFQRGPIPPGLLSYVRSPWVVTSERLRHLGWTPKVTNEQAYVEGSDGAWWSTVTPKRRQELALGAAAGALCAIVAALVWVVRRSRAVR